MNEPAPAPDDDQPIGLPRIDGDDGRGEDAPEHDLEGLGLDDEDEDDGGLDDGGFLPDESEIDDLDAHVGGATQEDWETGESEPHDDDPSIDVPDETSWLGTASTEGANDWPLEPDGAGEHAPSGMDAGEEGFAGEMLGTELELEGGASSLGAADEEGLDEMPALEGALDSNGGYEIRALEAELVPIPADVPASSIAALALDRGQALALALDSGGDTLVLLETAGRLSVRGRAAGAPRALLVHPTLGLVVVTSAGASVHGETATLGPLRALAVLGDGLLALAVDGTVLAGSTHTSLVPRGEAPARAMLCAAASDGGAVLVDERGAVHALSLAGTSRLLGAVPAREPFALAAAGRLCAVLTRGGGTWARLGAEVGFEPEPALRGATAIVGGAHGVPHLLALTPGALVRIAGTGPAESCVLRGGRVLATGDDGAILVATDTELLRVRLSARETEESAVGDEPG